MRGESFVGLSSTRSTSPAWTCAMMAHAHGRRRDLILVILLSGQSIGSATAFLTPLNRGVLLKNADVIKNLQQPWGQLQGDDAAKIMMRGRRAPLSMAMSTDRRSSLAAIIGAGMAAAALPVPAAHADYGQGRYDGLPRPQILALSTLFRRGSSAPAPAPTPMVAPSGSKAQSRLNPPRN